MQMPKLTKQHQKLEKFLGNWTGEETLHPSPWDSEGGQALSTVKTKNGMDGFHVTMDYVQKRNKKVTHRALGLFGFNPGTGKYTMNWFDNMGSGADPATGEFDGKKLVFVQAGPMGHSRYTFDFSKPNSYLFTMEGSQDGAKWMPFMTGRYKKAQIAASARA